MNSIKCSIIVLLILITSELVGQDLGQNLTISKKDFKEEVIDELHKYIPVNIKNKGILIEGCFNKDEIAEFMVKAHLKALNENIIVDSTYNDFLEIVQLEWNRNTYYNAEKERIKKLEKSLSDITQKLKPCPINEYNNYDIQEYPYVIKARELIYYSTQTNNIGYYTVEYFFDRVNKKSYPIYVRWGFTLSDIIKLYSKQ